MSAESSREEGPLETAADLYESVTTSINGFHRRRVIDAIFIGSNANNRSYSFLSAGRGGVVGGFTVPYL